MQIVIQIMMCLLKLSHRFCRPIFGLVFLAVGIYLAIGIFQEQDPSKQMERWLKNTGNAELLRNYQQATDNVEKKALGVVFRTYEKQYGKGAWISHYNVDNLLGGTNRVCYADIATIALGMSGLEEREVFLDSHADSYDACVRAGLIGEAHRYASLVKEIHERGGKTWRVVAGNPFSVCVYDQVKENQDLWNWYMDNRDWCDKFLLTFTPDEDEGLVDGLKELCTNARLYQTFAKEIDGLSEEEIRELTDADTEEDARISTYKSAMVFVQQFGDVLKPLAERSIPLIESMAVVANSCDALGLDSPAEMRKSGEDLAKLHDLHRIIWDNAASDSGAHVVWLSRRVPIAWAEQVVGAFGEEHVATFLKDNYWDSNDRLLSAATETIYRCKEPGWACLQTYRLNSKFKDFLVDPKIGFRSIPYILKFGEEKAFAEMEKDPRWVDECFDKEGNLKRQDVSWYEMSPIGGDLGTVLKKYCQGRPVSMGEIGWAAFDAADMVAMAFTFGMSKVAASATKAGAKTALQKSGKAAAKRIGKQTEKKLLSSQMRRIEQKSIKVVGRGLVNAERRLPGSLGKGVGKGSSRKGWKVFKRMVEVFKKTGNGVAKGTKNSGKAIGKGWRAMKQVPPKTWERAYRASKAVMWLKWVGHTLPAKGPDFVAGVGEDVGKQLGKMVNAIVAGAGEAFKSAIKEAVGGGNDDSIVQKLLRGGIVLLLCFFAFKMLVPRHQAGGIAKCDR